ncbi:MAG: hypothetical protein KA735_05275 [Burkholderiaceae bacterium]|nr:hypothetical protein [Burkholderiaceae bacterium]
MMNLANIREYARHQHLRGVDVVEVEEEGYLVRIRVDSRPAIGQADARPAATPDDVTEPKDTSIVRSQALGIFRLSHPTTLPTAIAKGDAVTQDQVLALLELGETLSPVSAPADGILAAILASDGQIVDYGMPLFQINPAQGGDKP